MKKTTHFIWTLGISLFIFKYVFYYSILPNLIVSFITAFFSSLPDIDIKIIKKVQIFNRSTFYIFYILTIPFQLLFKHRTWTHTIYLPILFLFIAEFFTYNFYVQIICRILYLTLSLHIIEDSFTVSGVRLFYPFNLKLRIAKFSTNSFFDYLILNLVGFGIIISFITLQFLN